MAESKKWKPKEQHLSTVPKPYSKKKKKKKKKPHKSDFAILGNEIQLVLRN